MEAQSAHKVRYPRSDASKERMRLAALRREAKYRVSRIRKLQEGVSDIPQKAQSADATSVSIPILSGRQPLTSGLVGFFSAPDSATIKSTALALYVTERELLDFILISTGLDWAGFHAREVLRSKAKQDAVILDGAVNGNLKMVEFRQTEHLNDSERGELALYRKKCGALSDVDKMTIPELLRHIADLEVVIHFGSTEERNKGVKFLTASELPEGLMPAEDI